jgi:hypothetical protein
VPGSSLKNELVVHPAEGAIHPLIDAVNDNGRLCRADPSGDLRRDLLVQQES